MTDVLRTIDGPRGLHLLGAEQLTTAAQEVRERIIETVGEIGGHLGANLEEVGFTVERIAARIEAALAEPVGVVR